MADVARAVSPEPDGPEAPRTVDDVLARIRAQMDLDAESEHDVLAEIRAHLEEAVAAARAEGLDEAAALVQAAARFGAGEDVGRALQQAHAGRATADAVIAAALPVVAALVLRWLSFAPDGTALGWRELAGRPAFWIVAVVALIVPLVKFERRRYALVLWAVFWALTVVFYVWPAARW